MFTLYFCYMSTVGMFAPLKSSDLELALLYGNEVEQVQEYVVECYETSRGEVLSYVLPDLD